MAPSLAANTGVDGGADRSPLADSDILFESIMCDVLWRALEVGALTMMLSAVSQPRVNWTIRSCRHLLCSDAKAILLALRFSAEVGLGNDVGAKLTRLLTEIAEAKSLLKPLADLAAYSQAQRASLVEHGRVWRRIAAEASNAMAMLDPQIKTRLSEVYQQDAETLLQFLKLAADGDNSAVNDFGTIRLPELKQRRHSPRVESDRECELLVSTVSYRARLKDVSRKGLGIVCDCSIAEGAEVIVVLPDGRRLDAIVVRRAGTLVGVALRQPLSLSDPLFRNSPATGQ